MAGGLQQGLSRSGVGGATINIAGQTAVFHGDPIRWGFKNALNPKGRAGRGGNRYTKYRYLYASGGGAVTVRSLEGDWPSPASQEHIGTISYTIHKTRTITVPILITGWEANDDPNKTDGVLGTVNYVTTGPPVFAGWPGSQPTATAPTATDLQMWNGTVFAVDANVLQSSGQLTIDWWDTNVADTNAAEISKLAAYIGAVSIPTPFKVKVPSITRDSLDGGTITIPLSLTDTKEDLINPLNYAVTDAAGANNSGLATDLNTTPADPGIAHTVARTTRVSEVNDEVTQTSVEYGKQSPKEDLEFEHDRITHDNARLLQNVTTIAQWYLTASGTPTTPPGGAPSGLKKRFEHDIPAGHDAQVHIWEYAQKDVLDDLQFEKTQTDTDPQDLNTIKFTVSALFTTGSPPSPDPTLSGLKITNKIDTPVTAADASNQSIRVYRWAKNDSKDDLEQANSWVFTPASTSLGAKSQVAALDNATPTTTPGLVNRGIKSYLAKTGHTLYIKECGTRGPLDDVEMPDRWFSTDTNALDPKGSDAQVYTAGSAEPTDVSSLDGTPIDQNTNAKVIGKRIDPIDDTYNKKTFLIGPNTPKEAIERLQSLTRTDATHIKQSARVVTVDSSVTTPANPDATNLSLVWCDSHQQNDSQYVNAAEYGVFTPAEEVIEEIQRLVADVNTKPLADGGIKALIDQSATPPSATAYTGFVATVVSTRRIAKLQYLHWWVYRFRSISDSLIAEKTRTRTDMSTIPVESSAVTAEIYTGSAPATPTLSGFVLQFKDDLTTPNPTYTLRVYTWGLSTPQDQIEFDGTRWDGDPLLPQKQFALSVTASALAGDALRDSLYGANKADVTFDNIRVRTRAPGKFDVVIEKSADTKLVRHGDGRTLDVAVAGIPHPSSGGFGLPDCQCKVSRNHQDAVLLAGLSVWNSCTVTPITVSRTRNSFTLIRRFITTDPHSKLFSNLQRCVNNAALKGYAQYELRFMGATYDYDHSDSSGHRVIVYYEFETDSMLWFNDGNLSYGYQWCYISPINISGPIKPTLFIDSTWTAVWPTAADLSAIWS